MLEPYVGMKVSNASPKSPLIFRCPSDFSSGDRERTYSMTRSRNASLNAQGMSNGTATGRALSEVESVATTLFLVEKPDPANYFGDTSGVTTDRPLLKLYIRGSR